MLHYSVWTASWECAGAQQLHSEMTLYVSVSELFLICVPLLTCWARITPPSYFVSLSEHCFYLTMSTDQKLHAHIDQLKGHVLLRPSGPAVSQGGLSCAGTFPCAVCSTLCCCILAHTVAGLSFVCRRSGAVF
jgi:hypothetical protein